MVGIIGILQLAKQLHKIEKIKHCLDGLINNNYRISPELYERALKKAGEH
jgi:predicted nucleic acid-binding protein